MLPFKVIEKEIDIILGIITDFQNDARVLVETLSYLHGLEIDKKFPMNTFALLKCDRQQLYGALNEEWAYFLHGYECRFSNIKNGHIVNVILKFEDEYGAIDPYFLGNYIKTNPKYIDFDIPNEFEYGLKIIQFLQKRKMLTKIKNSAQVIIGFERNEPIYISQEFKGIKLQSSYSHPHARL